MQTKSTHILTYEQKKGQYSNLSRAAAVLAAPPAEIIGRDLGELCRALRNPEKANVVLLAEPGSGKTAYVQAFAYDSELSKSYLVLNVNPELLIEKDGDRDNALLVGFNALLDEASRYSREQDVIVVLFVDEFHKLIEISPSLVESLKPRLEKSALQGFRLVAATTFQEYNQWVAPNQALDQRFIQIKLPELSKAAVLTILKNRAKEHGVEALLDEGVLEEVYTETKRMLPANAQPRASIDVFNSMIGDVVKRDAMQQGKLVKEYYTAEELGLATDQVLSRSILKQVIRRMSGVDIDNETNVLEVIDALKARLYNQDHVIELVARQLEMAFQGFGELDRPKFSFISTGSTGSGKAIVDSEFIPAPVPEGFIQNGDLKAGDLVYNRHGKPVFVTGVYPQGFRTVYRLTLADGRQMCCARDHLWTYQKQAGRWKTATTEVLMEEFCAESQRTFLLPQNEAVEREAKRYALDPYVLGVLLGNDLYKDCPVCVNARDRNLIAKMSRILGMPGKKDSEVDLWYFVAGKRRTQDVLLSARELLREVPELLGTSADKTFIPDCYKFGSVNQRWSLIQGLFDFGGAVRTQYLSYSTTSRLLAEDIREVLWSLGISSFITIQTDVYHAHVMVEPGQKAQFFRLERKLRWLKDVCSQTEGMASSFLPTKIESVERLNYKESMTCIMVDDPEHLYLAGKGHIVTHNTELAKIVSETMRIPLKRFDMSRYSDPADANAFADDLFRAAWSAPNGYFLIDEVEKSSKKAMNILLQVLDDARLTDSVNSDRVASFSGAIINLTTNLGSEVYRDMARHQSQGVEADIEVVYKSLADSEVFETAVLGRLDAIVPFHPLPAEALTKIATRMLAEAISTKETKERRILVSEDVIPYIVKDRTSYDTERGGARDVKRNVKNLVIQELAHYLTYAKAEVPVILYIKGRPRFKYKDVADPLNAKVAIRECYARQTVEVLLTQLSSRLGKPLSGVDLYLPNDLEIKEYVRELAALSAKGYHKFTSRIVGETVRIEGV